MTPQSSEPEGGNPSAPSRNEPIIDVGAALVRLDGDTELLRMLAEIFPEDSAQLAATLREGAHANDAVRVERAAHSLKSLSANFNARHAVEAAAEIECLANQDDLQAVLPKIPELERRLADVGAALEAMWTKPPLAGR